jgi:hypothetical protein
MQPRESFARLFSALGANEAIEVYDKAANIASRSVQTGLKAMKLVGGCFSNINDIVPGGVELWCDDELDETVVRTLW